MAKRPHEVFCQVNPKGNIFAANGGATAIDFSTIGFSSLSALGLHRTGRVKFKKNEPEDKASLWIRELWNNNKFELGDQQHFQLLPNLGNRPYVCEFGPLDSNYSDNEDNNQDYGVIVSYLNTKPPGLPVPGVEQLTSMNLMEETETIEPIELDESKLDELPDNDFSDPTILRSITVDDRYRGWYENSTSHKPDPWLPAWSQFHGRPRDSGHPQGRHNGVDIFCQFGKPVRTPVVGKLVHNPFKQGANNPDLGRTSVIEWRVGSTILFVVFAHLSQNQGLAGSIVQPGTIVGLAGNSGNANRGLPYDFDHRNSYGGRSDHVHVDVRTKLDAKYSDFLDPVSSLGLRLNMPT
jgi:murein DD-endopeptidase MepM/ murein hydrolase activator NlpD